MIVRLQILLIQFYITLTLNMMPNIFTIIFTKGLDYPQQHISQLQSFHHTIYHNFCLLSWLIPDLHIRVIDQIIIDSTWRIKTFLKGSSQHQYYILERRKDNFIYYSMGQYEYTLSQTSIERAVENAKRDQSIQAQFAHDDKMDCFRITLLCKTQVSVGLTFHKIFLSEQVENRVDNYNYFNPPCKKPNRLKGSEVQIEYYYIQPENRRYRQPQGYHLNLAFQGGGAKGVSYVGVQNAIQKLQERITIESEHKIELPVKSVIGSSAGGIISLAISAGLQHQDLVQISYMMDTLVEDKLIPTQNLSQSSLNSINQKYSLDIKSQFFGQQQVAIKNMLHNLGLVEDSLSEIIFETLKQPSVQQKIFQLFAQLNPSIGALLSFRQPYQRGVGQSIKNCCGSCCCCCYTNCCGTYPCCKATPCSRCFIIISNQYRKINIYGLLYAALITGDAVENIIAYTLSLFLEAEAKKKSAKLAQLAKSKWFNCMDDEAIFNQIKKNALELRKDYKERVNHLDQHYLQNVLIKFCKQITLKQYYFLNGVEFTCTSVDLNDKILRFFNHKTSPNLPVCRAVQMTGSFPAAFLSLQWRKQWGKYYIHYNRTRREIDLTGHNFTDGGLLANFPLKFLDNEKFRQKYFSHKSVPDKTILYGFGLQRVQDFPEADNSQKIKICMNNLLQQFKHRIMYKLILHLMRWGSTRTLQIKNIKLFQFLLSLADALRQSDRNLNKQCFKYEIIETVIRKKAMQDKQEFKAIRSPLTNFLNSLQINIRAHFFKEREEFLNDEFNSIFDGFLQYERAERQRNVMICEMIRKRLGWSQIQQIERRIQNNILVYSKQCIQIYQRRRHSLRNKYSASDLFMTSATLHHQTQILSILYQLKNCLMMLPQNQFNQIKSMMHKNCNQYYRHIRSIYQKILENIEQQGSVNYLQRQAFIKQKQVVGLLNMKHKLSPFTLAMFNNIDQITEFQHKTPIINFYVEEQTYLTKNKIRTSINNQIMQKKGELRLQNKDDRQTRLHIILQASYFSHYYFTSYIKIVQQVISDKDLKIDIISCTSYHAIFGVFYLLGYEPNNIKRRMYQIQYLFEKNQHIGEIYASEQWMKTSISQLRTLLNRQWQKQIDPFEMIQHQSNQVGGLTQVFSIENDVTYHIEEDQQYIHAAFQKVIDYISASFREVSQLSKQQRQDRFDQLLSLGKYRAINQKKSKAGQKIINLFLKYTINLMMITAEYIFENQQFALFSARKWSQETIFKGMVISSLINAFKYKIYIYDILGRAGLDRNITLSKFYQVCQRKIILNFNCTNTTQKRFSLINKVTKPNMPLWAALMACASLPYLEGEFQSYQEWENKQKGDIKIQMADMFFRQSEGQNNNAGKRYISGNAISTLPIELMTNQRLINSKLTDSQKTNTIEIVFAFDSQFHKQNKIPNQISQIEEQHHQNEQSLTNFFNKLPAKMQGRRRFINFLDFAKYLLEGICKSCCEFGLDYFKDILQRIGTLTMLTVKMKAHDRFILNLYYDSLIRLPVRMGALDFYKINKERPDLEDAVIQAQQVVRQICDTIQVNPLDKRQLIAKTPLRATIQVSSHKCDIYNKDRKLWQTQKQFYRIKFISYTKWRDFNHRYIIQYSLNTNLNSPRRINWLRIQEDYVDFPKGVLINNQYKLLLRFTYFQNQLVSKIYMVSMKALRSLQLDPARAIFSLNYRQIYSHQQQILTINQPCSIIDKIHIQSYFIPRSSMHCSNFECTAQKLEYVLMKQEYSECFSCSGEYFLSGASCQKQDNQVSLIAMKCWKCNKNYCLKCKLKNFIVKKFTNLKQDSYHYKCPKDNGEMLFEHQTYEIGKAPIIHRYLGDGREIIKNNCLYCEKYSNKLLYEADIVKGNRPQNYFSGLRICEICILYNVN